MASDAELFGPKSIEKKQPSLSGKLQHVDELQTRLSEQIQLIQIRGNNALKETVIYHKESQTLIVTDLIFNMKKPMPLGRKIILSLARAKNGPAQSQLVTKTIKDKDLYLKSIEEIESLDIRKIIMAHGEIIEDSIDIKNAMNAMRSVSI